MEAKKLKKLYQIDFFSPVIRENLCGILSLRYYLFVLSGCCLVFLFLGAPWYKAFNPMRVYRGFIG
jgi:hypothetical protein